MSIPLHPYAIVELDSPHMNASATILATAATEAVASVIVTGLLFKHPNHYYRIVRTDIATEKERLSKKDYLDNGETGVIDPRRHRSV